MTLDSRIPLGVQGIQIENPLSVIAQVEQIKQGRAQADERALAAQEARDKRTRQQQIDQALEGAMVVDETTGRPRIDPAKLVGHLPASLIPGVMKEIDADLKTAQDFSSGLLDLEAKRQKHLGSAAQTIRAANYDPQLFRVQIRAAQRLHAIDDDMAEQLLALPDERIQPLVDSYITQAGGASARGVVVGAGQRVVDPVTGRVIVEGGPATTGGFTLGAGQSRYGPTGELIAAGPPATAAAGGFTLAPGGARYGPTGEVIASRPAAPSSGTEPLVAIMGPDGHPVLVPRSQAAGERPAAGAGGRPATEGERKAAGFYSQMQQALTNINQLEAKLSERDLYQIQSLPQEGFTGAINRSAMSENAKRYIQAFNQFTEARLRPVSGAAIADSEYARDRATYGKQYAETPDLAEQRQAARGQALEALRVMGGSALEGGRDETTRAPRPPGETRRQQTYHVGQILTVNGQRVRVTRLLPNGKYEGEVVR